MTCVSQSIDLLALCVPSEHATILQTTALLALAGERVRARGRAEHPVGLKCRGQVSAGGQHQTAEARAAVHLDAASWKCSCGEGRVLPRVLPFGMRCVQDGGLIKRCYCQAHKTEHVMGLRVRLQPNRAQQPCRLPQCVMSPRAQAGLCFRGPRHQNLILLHRRLLTDAAWRMLL